jgi:hypothetical protein
LIEAAYQQQVLPVWTQDEAGPYQTLPFPGTHWHPAGKPVQQPHEYVWAGTAKQLTLFHETSPDDPLHILAVQTGRNSAVSRPPPRPLRPRGALGFPQPDAGADTAGLAGE